MVSCFIFFFKSVSKEYSLITSSPAYSHLWKIVEVHAGEKEGSSVESEIWKQHTSSKLSLPWLKTYFGLGMFFHFLF